jgi:hypothetical protein
VALKVAPIQGWGVYYNDAHPSTPFTPVEVNPTTGQTTSLPAGSLQGGPQAAAAASSVTDSFSAVNFAQMNSVVSTVGTTSYLATGSSQGGTSSSGGSSGSGHDQGDAAPLSISQLNFHDGWYVTPSVANETGGADQGSGLVDDGTGVDLAGWGAADFFLV